MFEVQLETYHKPLCLAPTLRPARAVLDVDGDWQVLRLKQEIQALCRTVSGQSMLAPSRQMLSVKQEIFLYLLVVVLGRGLMLLRQ